MQPSLFSCMPKALSPLPRWERDFDIAPLLPFWEKGVGDEGQDYRVANITEMHPMLRFYLITQGTIAQYCRQFSKSENNF